MSRWYYGGADNPTGPIDQTDLVRLAAEGAIKPTDLVWRDGSSKWVLAARVKGLQFGSPPPLPPANGVEQPRAEVPPTPGREPEAYGLHLQRKLMLLAAVGGMAGTFMPWYHVPVFGMIDGTRGDGWPSFAMLAFTVLLAFSGPLNLPVRGFTRNAACGFAVFAALIAHSEVERFKTNVVPQKLENLADVILAATCRVEIGPYFPMCAGAAVPLLAFAAGRRM